MGIQFSVLSPYIMAMGIWYRIHILCCCCDLDHVFHRTYELIVLITITADLHLFSIYNHTVRQIPEPTMTGLQYRIETLIGITGSKMQKYRISWTESILNPFCLIWRPHLIMLLIFEVIFQS